MTKSKPFQANGLLIVTLIALGLLLFHCYFNNRYGYFRDEFDYLSCGNHLAWGYVDQPPLLPFLVRLSRTILGDSLRSIRFIPALAISLVVVLTAMIAREFGGRRFSLVLSAVNVAVVVSTVRNTAGQTVFPLVLALVALSVVTLAQVWRNAVA